MEKNKKAIAVLSGGLDSVVASSVYVKDYDIHAITFDYGQKSVKYEIKASKRVCETLGFKHTIIDLPWLSKLGNSALTCEEELPLIDPDDLDNKSVCDNSASKVWVPGRNIVFTAIATSFAEDEGASIIIVGWDKEEAATFPDNSKEFLESFNQVLDIGSTVNVEIKAPAIDLDKKEIVKLGYTVNAPMELSYSCYRGNKQHCGICESCLRRKRAFKTAGINDPTDYLE
ncbi:7-cyano-7-deazaguanine synthase QueC [Methanobrevibacter filiformis]|uniref:7-cyano-7-deazaguanine synthase n=1 Tax=Methanobrevibacter filiformis TaxID=55758 RepID=A0A165YUH5_9EURY|nr:7-cyano-7-deazaguanine synthase QueC [Methanobrevibacter filiformis]KZX09882.1 7-cyano-7-deazaguanine synthase [Methanobrevibacter filiformis]